MKYVFYFCLFIFALSLTGNAQIPRTLSYQGILTDSSGNPKPDGFYSITFLLYTDKDGGSSFWSETKSLMVKKGLFSTLLGDNTFIPSSVKFDQQYWLGIKVSSEPELKPRVRLSSAAYSLNAEQSRRAIYADTASVAQITVTDTAWKVSGPDIFRLGGRVGIGTNNPSTKLHVASITSFYEGYSFAITTSDAVNPALRLNIGYDAAVNAGVIQASEENVSWDRNLLLNPNAGKVGIGTTTPDALFTVRGTGTFNGHHIALFENTDATSDGDGIAIKIDNPHTNAGNNFITFYNGGSATVGRIEGFDYENHDWQNSPPIPDINPQLNIALRDHNEWFDRGMLPSPTLNGGQSPQLGCNSSYTWTFVPGTTITWCTEPTLNPGTFPTLGGDVGRLPLVTGSPLTIGNPPLTFNMPTQQELIDLGCYGLTMGSGALQPMYLISSMLGGSALGLLYLEAEQICKDEGVTYGSKGADYAEWLEKENPAEDIRWGEIVGVRGGKISKVTKNAEQVMVISRAPVVLGNQPPEGKEGNYERVAFMGQVNVTVIGMANAGDYILASGKEDGFGVAVSPEKLQAEDLTRIVGRAWENSKDGRVNFINVVVGVNHEAASYLLSKQSNEVTSLKTDNEKLQSQIAELKTEQTRMAGIVEQLSNTIKAKLPAVPVTQVNQKYSSNNR